MIDTSGSMRGAPLASAVEAVKAAASSIPNTTAVGLRSYAGSCDQGNVDPLVPIGTNNDFQISTAADGLVAGGGTPTTAALGEALTDVSEFGSIGEARVVLLTDGDTQCGVSVCDFVNGLGPLETDITLYTVGLSVSVGAAADLQCAATATGGEYIAAESPEDLVEALNLAAGGGDRDGDGLPDTWEEFGYRAEAGLVLVDLPGMGADPDRPDIFLRLDATRDTHLDQRAEQIVVDAFAEQGIALHIVHGPELDEATANSWAVYEDGDDRADTADYQAMFEYWAGTSPWLASVFHYGASVRWKAEFAGQAAAIGSQQMVLTVCGNRNWRGGCAASVEEQAVVLMHELGHQLGLQHGGNDGIAYKPNYLSVMNYSFSVENIGIPGIGITYSSWGEDDLNILDERSISESDGILDFNGSLPEGARTFYYCPKNGRKRFADIGGPIDWNCQRKIEEERVSANVDYPRSIREGNQPVLETLRPHDDWANLDYRGGGNIGVRTVRWIPGVPIA